MSSDIKSFLLGITLLSCIGNAAWGMENVAYMLRGDATDSIMTYDKQLSDFKTNAKAINVIIPQAYQIDSNGGFWGGVDSALLADAKLHHIKVMPMVTNHDYDAATLIKFLKNPDAQKRSIQYLVDACKKNHFYGYQFDFENIPISQKDAFSQFYRLAATTLHANNCAISVAIIPRVSDDPGDSYYLKSKFENWSGAYDYKVLGENSDFVTIMAYEQHGGITTPGPVAGIPWVTDIIKYALKYIPPQKISLGIAVNSSHFYTSKTGDGIRSTADDVSHDEAMRLINKFNAELNWDKTQKVSHAVYTYNQLNEYVFLEDQKSLAAKIDLIKQYHLRGISIWRLGIEDPKIWALLNKSEKNNVPVKNNLVNR